MKSIKTQLPLSRAEIRGRTKQIKGRFREGMGKLRHNRAAQLRGRIERAEGKVRESLARSVRRTRRRL